MDCIDQCACTDTSKCDNICPRKPSHFVARIREIRGFGMDDIPKAPDVRGPELPPIVPEIMHGKRRASALTVAAAAIPLSSVFYARTGQLRFLTRGNHEAQFKIRPQRLIIDGVAEDRHLENYWAAARSAGIADAIRILRPDLITVPNYSLFTDVPRWDNLYNMKRIALSWYELHVGGNAVALHVNARTDRDYERWGAFLREHREIQWIAFEFATGASVIERGDWHATHLKRLNDKARRPLNLVVRGGRQHLNSLRASFQDVSFVTTDPFMKTMKRRRLRLIGGKARWTPTMTFLGQPLDDLLADNIAQFERLLLGGPRGLGTSEGHPTIRRAAGTARPDSGLHPAFIKSAAADLFSMVAMAD